MIRALSLDIAKSATGWAFIASDGSAPSWGTYHTLDWSKKTSGRELVKWRQWLAETISKFGVNAVAVEEIFINANPRMFDFGGTQAQMMLAAHVIEICETEGIPFYEINISDWRQSFLGFCRRPKDAGKKDKLYWKRLACKACANRDWYVALEEHDSAEALGIADYSVAQLDPAYRIRTNPARGREVADRMFQRGHHA